MYFPCSGRSAGSGEQPPTPTKATKSAFGEEYAHVERHHLNRIATLGVGGFGRVDLVRSETLFVLYFPHHNQVYIAQDRSKTYALKSLKKRHIVDTRQQEHIFSERNIMLELNSEWIVK